MRIVYEKFHCTLLCKMTNKFSYSYSYYSIICASRQNNLCCLLPSLNGMKATIFNPICSNLHILMQHLN